MKDPRANPWYLSQTRLAIVLGKSNLGEQSEARRTNRLTIKGSFIIPELYLVPLINMMIPDVFFNPSPGHFYCSAIYEIGCETLVLIFHVCWGGGDIIKLGNQSLGHSTNLQGNLQATGGKIEFTHRSITISFCLSNPSLIFIRDSQLLKS